MPTVTTKDPGRGGGDDSPAVRGKCREATKGDGPRAGRPERSPWGSLGGIPLNGLLHPFLPEAKDGPGVLGGGPNAPYAGTCEVR